MKLFDPVWSHGHIRSWDCCLIHPLFRIHWRSFDVKRNLKTLLVRVYRLSFSQHALACIRTHSSSFLPWRRSSGIFQRGLEESSVEVADFWKEFAVHLGFDEFERLFADSFPANRFWCSLGFFFVRSEVVAWRSAYRGFPVLSMLPALW